MILYYSSADGTTTCCVMQSIIFSSVKFDHQAHMCVCRYNSVTQNQMKSDDKKWVLLPNVDFRTCHDDWNTQAYFRKRIENDPSISGVYKNHHFRILFYSYGVVDYASYCGMNAAHDFNMLPTHEKKRLPLNCSRIVDRRSQSDTSIRRRQTECAYNPHLAPGLNDCRAAA